MMKAIRFSIGVVFIAYGLGYFPEISKVVYEFLVDEYVRQVGTFRAIFTSGGLVNQIVWMNLGIAAIGAVIVLTALYDMIVSKKG